MTTSPASTTSPRARLPQKLGAILRRGYQVGYGLLFGRWLFEKLGRRSFIHPLASVRNHCSIRIGNEVTVSRNVCLWPSRLVLGDRVEVNPGVRIYGDVLIGDGVTIAPLAVIAGGNHGIAMDGVPMIEQPCTTKGIVIEKDVWIGARCSILDGVTVAEGCVIGAGSVVTKSTMSNGIYSGVPATLLKMRTV